jgi:hypothetical protein
LRHAQWLKLGSGQHELIASGLSQRHGYHHTLASRSPSALTTMAHLFIDVGVRSTCVSEGSCTLPLNAMGFMKAFEKL